MKVVISLGSKQLVLEPQTDFEREVFRKYFPEETKAYVGKDGALWINWSGPVGRDENRTGGIGKP